MEKIELLQEKLEKERAKKLRAEQNIKMLEDKIKQEQVSKVSAMMKEYNVDFATLSELIKKHNSINQVVQGYEE